MIRQAINDALVWGNRVPEHINVAERRAYALLRFGFLMGCLAHFLSLLYFLFLDQNVLALINIASVLLLAWASWCALTVRDLRLPVILVFLVDVPVHNVIATLYLGVASFYLGYLLLVMMLMPLMPFFSRERRLIASMFLAFVFVGAGAVSLYTGPIQPVSNLNLIIFFTCNAILVTAFTVIFAAVYETSVSKAEAKLEHEFRRAEGLLLNILPETIAERLKDNPALIADDYPQVSVLFADIVNFTEVSSAMSPAQLVKLLNTAFLRFDALVEKHKCEKIKTIGDAYMVVCGAPEEREDHAEVLADLAISLRKTAESINSSGEMPFQLRIGINSGPIVAGVIGHKKFAYDLWGDTVNLASRMESYSEPGMIQITESTKNLLDSTFEVKPLGAKMIKGKGAVETYEVIGRISVT